jgi:large subunit ribosomal protein L29
MKAAELKDLTVEELSRKAGELRENLFNLKIRRRAGTLESVSDVTKNKRDLARILTLLTQKNGSSKAQKKAASRQPPAASRQPPAASPQPPAASQPSAEKKA